MSQNHFAAVNVMARWNDIMVTGSQAGKTNLKIWKINNTKLSMTDERSFSVFSILKSGYREIDSLLMIPPPEKTNVNATLHVAFTGSDKY